MNAYDLPLPSCLPDPATLHILPAVERLCHDQPGSIHPNYYEEVGRFLHPVAEAVRTKMLSCQEAHGKPEWVSLLDTAAAKEVGQYHVWLGKHLSKPTTATAPLYQQMRSELAALEHVFPFGLASNVAHLQASFALTDAEARILLLAACNEHSGLGLGYLSIESPDSRIVRAVAAAIGMPIEEASAALEWGSTLCRSGLLQKNLYEGCALRDVFELSELGKRMFAKAYSSPQAMFQSLLVPFPPPAFESPLEWPTLVSEQRTVHALLQTALAQGESGINILLYGPPGTGKTEFAKSLAHAIGCHAYEVAWRDESGDEPSRAERLGSLHMAQRLLGRSHPAVLVLDEAEDIFLDDFRGRRSTAAARVGSKAWMNRLLETNPQPVIWISNSTDNIDAAYCRRFTFSIRFDVPDIAVRRQIAARHLHAVGVTEATMDGIARRRELPPAVMATSARVVQLAAGRAGSADDVALCHLNSYATLMGSPTAPALPQAAIPFDPAYLHLDGRLSSAQILEAIGRHGQAAVLMSGPPGTGKTQLAGMVAQRLGRDLLCYSAADINRKWFGESEQQVSQLFSSCDPKRQVLFLDEAEVVLGAREDAQHRGAEAVTAEFLRQLELFEGVFLCATNHAGQLDRALMRRFTFRLRFKPLTQAQRERLLKELLGWPEQQPTPPDLADALTRLDGLTPGDFANVKKRFALMGIEATAEDWLSELHEEWKAAPHATASTAIGFL